MRLASYFSPTAESGIKKLNAIRDGLAVAASNSILDRQFRGERASRPWTLEKDAQSLQRIIYRVIDGSGFITAMSHAVGAFMVVAGAVAIPIRFFDQLSERSGIAFV